MNIIIQSTICFLTIYGAIQIVLNIYDFLCKNQFKDDNIYIIITVKNQQDTIEGIIRAVVWRSLNNYYGGIVPTIFVIDMGSTDETLQILDKLCKDYEFIEVINKEEYEAILEKIMS